MARCEGFMGQKGPLDQKFKIPPLRILVLCNSILHLSFTYAINCAMIRVGNFTEMIKRQKLFCQNNICHEFLQESNCLLVIVEAMVQYKDSIISSDYQLSKRLYWSLMHLWLYIQENVFVMFQLKDLSNRNKKTSELQHCHLISADTTLPYVQQIWSSIIFPYQWLMQHLSHWAFPTAFILHHRYKK